MSSRPRRRGAMRRAWMTVVVIIYRHQEVNIQEIVDEAEATAEMKNRHVAASAAGGISTRLSARDADRLAPTRNNQRGASL